MAGMVLLSCYQFLSCRGISSNRLPGFLAFPCRIGGQPAAQESGLKTYRETPTGEYGVPDYSLRPAVVSELSTGIMLFLGVSPAEVGVVLSGWCLLMADIFHRDWQGDDGKTQQLMFMKNLCMAGEFLILAATPFEHLGAMGLTRWVVRRPSTACDAERERLLPGSSSESSRCCMRLE
jgi:uncharacterized membrane protein YphA (DoxX/SURF4 family)